MKQSEMLAIQGSFLIESKKVISIRDAIGGTLGLIAMAVGCASVSFAGTIITTPVGLAPGSQYRLVFVTADAYNAESSNISLYNDDVNNEANAVPGLAALGATWRVLGSTASISAIRNIGAGSNVPIYDLEGDLIASDDGTDV